MKTWVLATSAPTKDGGGDYRCSMGGSRSGLWEPVYGGHIELPISKDVKQSFGHSVKPKDKRGIRFPGTLCGELKEGQGNRFHKRINPS